MKKNAVVWNITPFERIATIIKMTRIRELATTLAVTSNRSTQRATRATQINIQ
jgi:uncharacterized membrane protein YadS